MVAESNTNIITIGGPVRVFWTNYDGTEEKEITDTEVIKLFDGSVYMDDEDGKQIPTKLSVYLQDGEDTEHLYELGVRGGTLKYVFKKDRNQLWIETEYNSPKKLTNTELKALYDFTEGQWYDGAGANFSGELSDQNNGISPLGHPIKAYVDQSGP